MADIDLPVWSVRPNWADGIRERLEWLTDVIDGSTGNEQRRSVRLSPRRVFDFTINPMLNDKAFVDLWMHKIGEEKFMLPLWHDQARLSAPALVAATRLDFDNTFREFEDGGLAILYRSTFDYEVVEIDVGDDTGLDLVNPLVGAWGIRSLLYPLRRSMFDPEVTSTHLSRRVGDLQLTAFLDTANDYVEGAEVLPLFTGYPILTLEPNRREDLRTTYTRNLDEMDSRLGKTYRRDNADRAFTTQFYNWQAKGRENHHKLRQTLYRLNGKQKGVWMPSFSRDAAIAVTANSGAVFIEIEKIGYAYLGTQNVGRDHLLLQVGNSVQIVKINSTGVASHPSRERLNLASALTFPLPVGTELSFVDTMRLDQDEIEMTHHTDSEGMCEVTAAFRSFTNLRNAAGTISHPIPVTAQLPQACGVNDEAGGNPCLPVMFEGWYFMFRGRIYRDDAVPVQNSRGTVNWNVSPTGSMGNSTTCKAFGSGTTSKCGFYEDGEAWNEYRYDYDIVSLWGGNPIDIYYQHQYSLNVHEFPVRMQIQYRHWYSPVWTTLFGVTGDGDDAQTLVDGSFQLGDLFPRDNYWTGIIT